MGHNRLGTLPDTRPWRRVVAKIADGEAVPAVAAATSAAAAKGLDRGREDPGVARVVFLLARVALAARADDFAAALDPLGVCVPPDPGLCNLAAAFADAARPTDPAADPPTDLGEMAALAAVEALTALVGARTPGLFPTGGEVHRAVRELATPNGFALLAFKFFARFARRFLLYHLGRELSHHVGGSGRFADHAAHAEFLADLDVHCREAAVVVRTYAGEWYPKAKFEDGVSERRAAKFAAHCLKKLRAELVVRGGGRRG